MKNENLLYSIGNIEDKYIIEAKPGAIKTVKWFRKPLILVAVIAAFLLLCAFTVYVVLTGDIWIQKPSKDPIETVRSAIENQIDKEYTISVDVVSIEIDEDETTRAIENYIGGEIARRRRWRDEYLAEHFIVVKAVYFAEYDHTKTYRDDGYNVQYFYLTQDVKTGKWTIVDNSGDVSRLDDDITGGNNTNIVVTYEVESENNDVISESGSENGVVPSIQEQITAYLSELYTEVYAPYYDGLHYRIFNYEETIVDDECTATFYWTMYHLGKGWDVESDEGVEKEGTSSLQVKASIINGCELDLSTISVFYDHSDDGSPMYSSPVEDLFPKQLAR
jgi:hypothetical protein